MLVKTIVDEDFSSYKKPSMYIAFPNCTFKCCIEAGMSPKLCQNYSWFHKENVEIEVATLVKRYLNNHITKAIVCAGMEPFDSFDDLLKLLIGLRIEYSCNDDVVIYTGYTEEEVKEKCEVLSRKFDNIIVKFGRYIPNETSKYDKTLGITLASKNQYAKGLS